MNFRAAESKLYFNVLSLSIFRFFMVVSSMTVVIVFSTVSLPGLRFVCILVAKFKFDFFNLKKEKKKKKCLREKIYLHVRNIVQDYRLIFVDVFQMYLFVRLDFLIVWMFYYHNGDLIVLNYYPMQALFDKYHPFLIQFSRKSKIKMR
jgi:hypothetical protein